MDEKEGEEEGEEEEGEKEEEEEEGYGREKRGRVVKGGCRTSGGDSAAARERCAPRRAEVVGGGKGLGDACGAWLSKAEERRSEFDFELLGLWEENEGGNEVEG